MSAVPIAIVITALAAAPDLTEQQRIMLESVTDRVAHIDEAGLYALLQNVNRWEGDASAGAMIPDYAALLANPEASRGKRFVIEGKLASVGVSPRLARSGWANLQPWYVETQPGEYAIVYLTAAPEVALKPLRDGHRLPRRAGTPVRIVARFYKVQALPNTQGEPRLYALFVGQTATLTGSGGDEEGGSLTGAVITMLVVMLGAFVVIRMALSRKRTTVLRVSGSRRQRDTDEEDEADGELDIRDDLPDDPAAALGVLRDETDAERKTIVNPLDAALADREGDGSAATETTEDEEKRT